MFKHFIKTLIAVALFFNYSTAQANYQEDRNKLLVAKSTTMKIFNQIEAYIGGLQENFDEYKQNCRTNVINDMISPCLGNIAYIEARLARLNSLIAYLSEYIKSYPEDLQILVPGIQKRISSAQATIEKTKSGMTASAASFKTKSKQILAERIQQSIVKGNLSGKSDYYCASFKTQTEMFDMEFEIIKSEDPKFSTFFQKNDEIIRYFAMAEIFKSDCPGKIDMAQAKLVLKKFSSELNSENANKYLKEKCPKLKDESLKHSCLKSGEKNIDLFYTLFGLEKAGKL